MRYNTKKVVSLQLSIAPKRSPCHPMTTFTTDREQHYESHDWTLAAVRLYKMSLRDDQLWVNFILDVQMYMPTCVLLQTTEEKEKST